MEVRASCFWVGEKALDNNDVLEDFHNQVISRENLSSTCFFDKFAIPHSNIQNALSTKLYVMVNNTKVTWNKSKINLVCLILIKRDTNDDFRKLYAGLSDILYDNNILFNNTDKIKNLDDFLYFLLK
ncbi:MAG: PTS sugar transporter subunit IIA [Erysipelotrichaceae bacterium]|nr:PTS sugar transporter subunit IIA [Erysipelotrichaceae bacterium]